MNETIALPRLAEIVARSAGCENAAAEKFIRDLFSHIEDTLAVDGSVAIGSLGTFTRTSDNEHPVIFTPDPTLAAAINEPFAMFEPVPVDGIAINDIIESRQEADSHTSHNFVPEPTAPEVSETIVDEDVTNLDENITQQVTDDENTVEPTAEIPECSPQTDSVVQEPATITEPQVIYVEAPYRYWIWVLIFLTGLILGLAIGFCAGEKFRGIFATQETIVVTVNDESESDEMTDSISTDTETEAINTMAEPIAAPAVKEQQPTISDIYDTVTPNRFLTTMSREYYGPMEYWAFIYEANADILGNPNRIKPGTRVRIPDKSEFSANETPEETLARAKALGRSIYERFDQ